MDFEKTSSKVAVEKIISLSKDIVLGMLPNYIHSFDALHMQNVVLELDKKGIQDIWSVHDSFGVHACDIDDLRDIVRETFVEIHQDPIEVHLKRIVELNRSILEPKFVDDYIAKIDKEIERINSSPNNDWINDVLYSKYLIS
jgi:DNA-directed RNA polymerase